MKIKRDKNFVSVFDPQTGFYVRSGIIENGKDTGTNPFQASYPELLDIGIMGHCKFGKSGKCFKSGVECYQNGLNVSEPNMKLEDFKKIVEESKGKLFQVALGGRGDPDEHEKFEEILKLCRDNEIVPNFTTSGFGMTPEKAKLCKQYCGAVAVSWYRNSSSLSAIKMLLEAEVKTNIHFVINKKTIEEAIHRLKENDFPERINAVVFLLHKPVGLGSDKIKIDLNTPEFEELLNLALTKHPFKVGFDSCTVPALIHNKKLKDFNCIDTCEGARFSAYVTPDMQLTPCSFDQDKNFAVSIKNRTISEAWNSKSFENFRKILRESCPSCKFSSDCLGGCPIIPKIVLCPDKSVYNFS